MDALVAGPVPSVAELVTSGVRAASPTGVLGDPGGADAELGREVLDAWVADLQSAVERAVSGWEQS
jgi:creatinine amidohydrolase